MHENRNLFLFLIEINNMHHTRHILPIPRTCIWLRCWRCGRCGVSWHRALSQAHAHPRLKLSQNLCLLEIKTQVANLVRVYLTNSMNNSQQRCEREFRQVFSVESSVIHSIRHR